MIDPIFRNINSLFVQAFKISENDPPQNSFLQYYIALVKIKDFNELINNKPFLWLAKSV